MSNSSQASQYTFSCTGAIGVRPSTPITQHPYIEPETPPLGIYQPSVHAELLILLLSCCRWCCRGKHSGKHIVQGTVHRVAIYDSLFRLVHIISQTDIIK